MIPLLPCQLFSFLFIYFIFQADLFLLLKIPSFLSFLLLFHAFLHHFVPPPMSSFYLLVDVPSTFPPPPRKPSAVFPIISSSSPPPTAIFFHFLLQLIPVLLLIQLPPFFWFGLHPSVSLKSHQQPMLLGHAFCWNNFL